MTTKNTLLKQVRQIAVLGRAWRIIHENGRTSQSIDTKREIEKFAENAESNLTRIQRQLNQNAFVFAPARGIAVQKKGKKTIRPLVVAPIESRIVQRAILDVVLKVPSIQSYANSPFSFGGIKKAADEALGAVPAAIQATLNSIRDGGTYVIRSDISSFFTRIPKTAVLKLVSSAIDDPEFMVIFKDAITVELANLAELKKHAADFPIYEIGVAQGNSLSPLLGNILLNRFDNELNRNDVRCIRYIDDFLLVASSKNAADALFSKALAILREHDLEISPEKTFRGPISGGLQFLGIELANGIIRPSRESRNRLLNRISKSINRGIKAFRSYNDTELFRRSDSLIGVMNEVRGIVNGWAKQYKFCNEANLFSQLDDAIDKKISGYLREYRSARAKTTRNGRRHLLGIEPISRLATSPFEWPKVTA
jgi:RNA-directed DNA polymerase